MTFVCGIKWEIKERFAWEELLEVEKCHSLVWIEKIFEWISSIFDNLGHLYAPIQNIINNGHLKFEFPSAIYDEGHSTTPFFNFQHDDQKISSKSLSNLSKNTNSFSFA